MPYACIAAASTLLPGTCKIESSHQPSKASHAQRLAATESGLAKPAPRPIPASPAQPLPPVQLLHPLPPLLLLMLSDWQEDVSGYTAGVAASGAYHADAAAAAPRYPRQRQAKPRLLLPGCGRSDLLDVQACSVEEGGDSGMSKAGMHENKLPLANSRRRHFAARRRRRPRSLPLLPVCPPAPAPPINHSSMYLASTYWGAATA
jgi:hypothetical protein